MPSPSNDVSRTPTPSVLVESSVPAACASLLSLRSAPPAPKRSASRFWETVMPCEPPKDLDNPTEEEASKMNIPCRVCGVRFRKPGHLNMHWRSVHASEPDAAYPGKLAHRVMAPAPAREGRVGKGVHGRAYGCPQCEARFRRGSDRNRHMRMVHAKIRPFECKQCGNHFGRKSFLEAHILTVHEKLRPYQCECGAAFGQRSSLTRHVRKIHGREP